MKMRGHDAPVLTAEQIGQQLDRPIGTRPLREIAAGKKTVVIAEAFTLEALRREQ